MAATPLMRLSSSGTSITLGVAAVVAGVVVAGVVVTVTVGADAGAVAGAVDVVCVGSRVLGPLAPPGRSARPRRRRHLPRAGAQPRSSPPSSSDA